MDCHRLFHCILTIFLFVINTSPASGDSVKEVQQQVQDVKHSTAIAEQELQKLQSDLAIILHEEPEIVAEYAQVSDELGKAFDEANKEDKQAHDNAMIASFRFNRIDRKHTRFMDKKQEKLAAIESTRQQLAQLRKELIFGQQQLAELKDEQIKNQALILAENKRQAQIVAALAQQRKVQAANKTKPPKVVEPEHTVTEGAVEPGWPSLDSPSHSSISYAQIEMARLQALPKKQSLLGRVKLRSTCGDNQELEYLGENIYSATIIAQGGLCKFTLYNKDFWFTLPVSHAMQYRLVYDTSSISSPQLFVFDEQLLLETVK